MTDRIPTLDECRPGLVPTGFNVLIAPAETQEKIGSIILPPSAKEVDQLAQVRGLLVSTSPLAFDFGQWPEGIEPPQAGDTVIYAKFGGILVTGDDGREYRLMTDKDVCAIVRTEAKEAA